MSVMYTRRCFLQRLGQVLLVTGLGHFWSAEICPSAQAALALPDGKHYPADYADTLTVPRLRQIVGADPSSACTIMWEMPTAGDNIVVEYMHTEKEGAAWEKPSLAPNDINDSLSYIYTAHLTRLEADSRYVYRLVRGETATPWHNIKTAGFGRVTAIIVADSQCGDNYDAWRDTIHAATKHFPHADFMADIGDLVDNGQSNYHWEMWYDACADILPDTLFVPVLGNHECYGLTWENSLPVGYYEQFSLPPNGSRRFGGDYYDFAYGPVHFYVLNTQFAELDGIIPAMKEAQMRWLRETAARNNRPWQVILMHKDILSYNELNPHTQKYGGLNDIAHLFMPVFDELNIDLVLTGHMHTYRNRGHIYNFQPAEHGPVYVMCGLSGNQHYAVPKDEQFDRKTAPQPEKDSYLHLDATAKRLQLDCYLSDGTAIDSITLSRDSSNVKPHRDRRHNHTDNSRRIING